MDYRKNINSQQEVVHPIIIWIIASILFHLLLALGVITLKIQSVPLMQQAKNLQDHAILMMDEPKRSTTQPSMPATSAQAEKKEPKEKKDGPKPSDYTLIPGRQGINFQNLDDPQNLQNLPKPKDQTLEKKAKIPEIAKEHEEQEEKTEKKFEEKFEKSALEPKNLQPQKIFKSQQTTTPLTKFTNQTSDTSSEQKGKIKKRTQNQMSSKQDPYQFVPQPSRIISFQDLNLGFDNNYATIGNNANLIQQGITTAAPDDVSLKHLTYYNQCAGMMKTAFATHPQTHLRQNATGKRFRFDLTVDRQGNQIRLDVIRESGDMILDRIIQESIASVKMFPKVPSFIEDSPFVMRWTFLH